MVAQSGRGVAEMVFCTIALKANGWPALANSCLVRSHKCQVSLTDGTLCGLTLNYDKQRTQTCEHNLNSIHLLKESWCFLKQTSCCDQPWSGPHCVSHIVSKVAVTLDGDSCPRHVSHLHHVPLTDAVNERSQTPVEPATFRSVCDDQSADDDNSSDEEHEETLTSASSQPDATVNSVAPEPIDNETGPDPTTHDRHPLS